MAKPWMAILPLIFAISCWANGPRWQTRDGEWFSLRVPADWEVLQTRSGLQAMAPDGTGLFLTLRSTAGNLSPGGCLRAAIRRREPTGLVQSIRETSPVAGPAGFVWRTAVAELALEQRGQPVRLRLRCAVLNGYGQNTAYLRGDYLPIVKEGESLNTVRAVRNSLAIRSPNSFAGLSAAELPDEKR